MKNKITHKQIRDHLNDENTFDLDAELILNYVRQQELLELATIKVGDFVKVPISENIGIVIAIRNVEGTKHQQVKKNKIDYLVKLDDPKLPEYYQDWFEEFRTVKVIKNENSI